MFSKKKITFNDFMGYRFYPKYFNGTWISDTEILFQDQVRLFQTIDPPVNDVSINQESP